jgi:uroporphyrinogen-III decarboxylase
VTFPDVGGQNEGARALLTEREQLITAAVALEQAERPPIVYQAEAFSPRFMGVPLHDYATDPDVAVRTTIAALDRLAGFDAMNAVPGGMVSPTMSSLWLSRMLIPGRELPEDSVWQTDEHEDMTAAEYEAVLRDGWPAFVEGFLPRVLDPDELAASDAWFAANWEQTVATFREHGFVPLTGAVVATPFEQLCGARSMHEFYCDLFRRPDVVRRATARMLPDVVAGALEAAEICGLPCVWVGGWRSASGMVSEAVWQEFVFPQLKELVDAVAEAGYTPILHFDHDWTRDLHHLRALPARRCILQLDGMTDIRRAKEVLGDHMALMGDVPPYLMSHGTVAEVRRYVEDLLRDVGDRGFLLAAGCDAPIDTRPENMAALVETGLAYRR